MSGGATCAASHWEAKADDRKTSGAVMRGVACNDCPPMWQKQQCFPRYSQLAWSWRQGWKGTEVGDKFTAPFYSCSALFCLCFMTSLPVSAQMKSAFLNSLPFFWWGSIVVRKGWSWPSQMVWFTQERDQGELVSNWRRGGWDWL